MAFKIIDRENWSRKEYFEHYLTNVPCTYSMTVKLNITRIRERKIKVYPAMLFYLTTIVNRHCEFRTSFNENNELGIYSEMIPCYTVFHKDTETFSNLWTVCTSNIEEFVVRDILNNKKKGSGKKIPKGKVIQTLRGVKRVKEAGGNEALQGLSLDMLMKVGEKDLSDEELAKIAARENNALAKKILEKSGQNIKSRRRKKVKLSDKSKEKKGILLRRNLSLKNLNDRV